MHPDDRSLVEATVAHALDPAGPGLYELDYRIIHPDGTVRWVGGKGKAFFEERNGGQVAVRFIGTVLDRTERRKIHDAMLNTPTSRLSVKAVARNCSGQGSWDRRTAR